jgi:hypothetical protein
MPEHEVETRKGVPAVSQLTWFWALVFTGFTSGLFALGMALHISWWVRNRRRAGVAFYGFLIVAVLTVIEFLPASVLHQSVAWEYVFTAGAVIWIASAFILRRELMLYYASPEGGVLEINPWLTGLFSIYYLNYCLWVVRDSA